MGYRALFIEDKALFDGIWGSCAHLQRQQHVPVEALLTAALVILPAVLVNCLKDSCDVKRVLQSIERALFSTKRALHLITKTLYS